MRAVPTAAWATVSLEDAAPGVLRFNPYWKLDQPASPTDASTCSLASATAELAQLLHDSIALQSVAAVPVGALLSGGLDSSVLSGLLVEARRRLGQTSSLVSVTAEDATGALDERPYMRAMARTLAGDDVTAIESSLDPAWVEASMDKVTWHQEEPLPGVALVAHYHAYHAAAAHGLRVVLEGTGSDELFAGYPRHQMARIQEHVHRREWVKGIRELAGPAGRPGVFGPWFRDVARAGVTTAGCASEPRPRVRLDG